MNRTHAIRLGAAAVVAMLVVGCQSNPAATPSGEPLPSAAPPTAEPSSSPVVSPSLDPNDTSAWLPFVSKRYGFSIAYPPDWSANPGDRDWTFPKDTAWPDGIERTDWFNFEPPDSDSVAASAWSVALEPGTSADQWFLDYCAVEATPCEGTEPKTPTTLDGHAGWLVPSSDPQAYFGIGDRIYLVVVWQPEHINSMVRYGGGLKFVETLVSTMRLLSPSEPTAAPIAQDIMGIEKFASLAPGTYFIDPDSDLSTPLRVVYNVPAEGWSQWFGAVKFTGDSHVMVNITSVLNVVRDGCRDHSWTDPPVGPTVDDLAVALAHLAPFRVTVGPKDITEHGYRGKFLQLTALDLPVAGGEFTGCVDGNLLSWVAPIDVAEREAGAFHGYNAEPVEEFWILDVDGARLVIEANWSIDSPPAAVAEMRAILDSIRIEP